MSNRILRLNSYTQRILQYIHPHDAGGRILGNLCIVCMSGPDCPRVCRALDRSSPDRQEGNNYNRMSKTDVDQNPNYKNSKTFSKPILHLESADQNQIIWSANQNWALFLKTVLIISISWKYLRSGAASISWRRPLAAPTSWLLLVAITAQIPKSFILSYFIIFSILYLLHYNLVW